MKLPIDNCRLAVCGQCIGSLGRNVRSQLLFLCLLFAFVSLPSDHWAGSTRMATAPKAGFLCGSKTSSPMAFRNPPIRRFVQDPLHVRQFLPKHSAGQLMNKVSNFRVHATSFVDAMHFDRDLFPLPTSSTEYRHGGTCGGLCTRPPQDFGATACLA